MGYKSAPACPCSSCFNGEGRFNGEEEHFPVRKPQPKIHARTPPLTPRCSSSRQTKSTSNTPAVKKYHVSRLGLRRRLGIGSTDADAVPLRMDAEPPGWSQREQSSEGIGQAGRAEESAGA